MHQCLVLVDPGQEVGDELNEGLLFIEGSDVVALNGQGVGVGAAAHRAAADPGLDDGRTPITEGLNAAPKLCHEGLVFGVERLDPDWPEDDEVRTDKAVTARIASQLRYSGSWPSLGWQLASDDWLHATWMRHGPTVVEQLAVASSWYAQQQRVPLVVDGVLRVGSGAALRSGVVLEPTLAGWRHFLEYAPESGLKFGELAQIGEYWWGRKIPRDLLSASRRAACAPRQFRLYPVTLEQRRTFQRLSSSSRRALFIAPRGTTSRMDRFVVSGRSSPEAKAGSTATLPVFWSA